MRDEKMDSARSWTSFAKRDAIQDVSRYNRRPYGTTLYSLTDDFKALVGLQFGIDLSSEDRDDSGLTYTIDYYAAEQLNDGTHDFLDINDLPDLYDVEIGKDESIDISFSNNRLQTQLDNYIGKRLMAQLGLGEPWDDAAEKLCVKDIRRTLRDYMKAGYIQPEEIVLTKKQVATLLNDCFEKTVDFYRTQGMSTAPAPKASR